jgi:chaperone modulatory protein CbpM
MKKEILAGVLVEQESVAFLDICAQYNLSEEVMVEFIEYGLITIHTSDIKSHIFDGPTVARIRSAWRLKNDLGINTPGVVLALDLIEELEALRNELQILKRQMG